MSWFAAVLCLGACLRLWRLWDQDEIGQPLRDAGDWLSERSPGWVTVLLGCPYCIGYYLATGVVASGYFWGNQAWWVIVAGGLSVNYVFPKIYERFDNAE